MRHAAMRVMTVGGTPMYFDTLWGLQIGTSAQDTIEREPDKVECKSCRRSQAWTAYVQQNNSS